MDLNILAQCTNSYLSSFTVGVGNLLYLELSLKDEQSALICSEYSDWDLKDASKVLVNSEGKKEVVHGVVNKELRERSVVSVVDVDDNRNLRVKIGGVTFTFYATLKRNTGFKLDDDEEIWSIAFYPANEIIALKPNGLLTRHFEGASKP